MKKLKDIIRLLAAAMLVFAAGAGTGCSDDETKETPVTEGVVFDFAMRTVYSIGSMTDMASVKVTLAQNGATFELPSLRLSGTDELVTTTPYRLAPGTYTFVSYIAYDKTAAEIFKVEVDTDNTFEVKANELTTYALPIEVRVVEYPTDYYRNAIYGLCVELFGEEDKDAWPWDFEKKDLRKMQKRHTETPYFEFDEDDYGNITMLTAVNITGEDFASMTEFPARTISNLRTLSSLTLSDLPNMTSIRDLETLSDIDGLSVINTGLKEIPEAIGSCPKLRALAIVNNPVTTVPDAVSNLKDLRVLHLRGNRIERIDTPLKGLEKLADVDFSDNPLTAIGEGVFAATQPINNLQLEGTRLAALPAVIGQISLLRGLNLAGCQFTSVPAAAKNNARLRTLRLSGNPMTTIAASDFAGMANLQNLFLSDMKATVSGRLDIPSLELLEMNDCGLTALPDLTGLTGLKRLELNGNDFTAVTETDRSKFNCPDLWVYSFNNCKNLSAFSIFDKLTVGADSYSIFDVSHCPKLQWTTPAQWKCFDLYLGDLTGQDETGNDVYASIFGPIKGRVAIDRTDSPGVKLGK